MSWLPRRRRHRRRHKCGMFPRIPLVRARSAAAVPLYFVLGLILFFSFTHFVFLLAPPPDITRTHAHALHSENGFCARRPRITFFRHGPRTGSSSGTRYSLLSRTRSPPACTRRRRPRPGVLEHPSTLIHSESVARHNLLASSRDG